ncbi:hypothetical protein PVAND_013063 [Polypedilum vanderplanki]|uniref:Uncharacterized protein n=1 Tax=Polypedilum vanderplanki TaxID=319348 RepID=A0A9J6CPK2_POLVA|nr:hypothetical protein PVAND_013063 [Polypedilum vanderplanki]
MKVIAFLLLAFVVFVAAEDGPTKISSNNVGDIVNVGVKANAKIDSKIDATIVKILLQYLNDQQIKIGLPGGDDDYYPSTFPPIEFPPIS